MAVLHRLFRTAAYGADRCLILLCTHVDARFVDVSITEPLSRASNASDVLRSCSPLNDSPLFSMAPAVFGVLFSVGVAAYADSDESARSEVFKKIFESDNFKASSRLETTTFSELKQEELEALVEFIYSDGSMLTKKGEKHVWSLYRAADKYEIPHLRDLCRKKLISSLSSSNALKILVLAQIPFDEELANAAFNFIKAKKSTISNSKEFEGFVVDHPHLTVEINQIMKAISPTSDYCFHCGRY
ncbi:hypothetical protein Bca4012_019800 [Brassica carinata]|uniref:BTB domain-containing protein n=1 Tax=Brassica carinata TaxID=52824 RepID=A0A8X7WGY1_BRACI|nr:hypothetical protein Bca52824_001794 [Brassica carinata]